SASPESGALSAAPAQPDELADLIDRLRRGRPGLWVRGPPGSGHPFFHLVERLPGAGGGLAAARAPRPLGSKPPARGGVARRRLGARLGEELLRVTRVPDEVPAGLADLVRLPFRAIVATTWDDAPVRALEQAGSHPRVLTPSDPPPEGAFAAERILFRLLG